MSPSDLSIPAADGHPLAATLYEPGDPEPDGDGSAGTDDGEGGSPGTGGKETVVILSSAVGVWRSFYATFAGYLADEGFGVVTYDYRGNGETPLPGSPFDVGMRHWGERDLAGVIDWVGERWPEARLVSVGHSAGAQLPGLAENNARIEALLGIAGGSGYWGHWSGPLKWLLFLLWHAGMPLLSRIFGRFPGRALGILGDIPAGVALEWASWCRTPGYVTGEAGPPSKENFAGFRGRLRTYAFTDDVHAPPAAVCALPGFYLSAEEARCVVVDPEESGEERIGHVGFFRLGSGSELWREAADWLREG